MESVFSMNSIVVADKQQVTGELPDGDVVVLSLKDGVYYGLNEVGGRIWQLLQEPVSIRDIQKVLVEDFEVEEDQCFEDIKNLLEDLAIRGLILVDQSGA